MTITKVSKVLSLAEGGMCGTVLEMPRCVFSRVSSWLGYSSGFLGVARRIYQAFILKSSRTSCALEDRLKGTTCRDRD